MQRHLAIIFMLISMVQIIPPLPGQDARTTGQGTSQADKKRKNIKADTTRSVAVQTLGGTPNTNGGTGTVAPENKEQSVKLTSIPPVIITDKPKNWIDHLFDWGPWAFALCLVAIGAVGVYLAIRTLRVVETQAGLQGRSIDLQERTMEQWVEHDNWGSEHHVIEGTPQGHILIIHFDVLNRTNFPLKLPDATIDFLYGTGRNTVKFREDCIIPPNRSQQVRTWYDIPESEVEAFAQGGIMIRVSGDLAYVGALGKKQTHPLSGVLWCQENRTRFEEETTRPQGDGKGQRPN